MKNEKEYSTQLYVYLRDNSQMFKEFGQYLFLNDEKFKDRPYALAFFHNALVKEKEFPGVLDYFIVLRMMGMKFEHSPKWGMKIVPVMGIEGGFENTEDYSKAMSVFTDKYGEAGRTWLLETLKSISTI